MSRIIGFHNHTWADVSQLTPKDPLNLFFVGDLARLDTVLDAFHDVVGWTDTSIVDGNQWFAEVDTNDNTTTIHRHDGAIASARFTYPGGSRFHVRLYAVTFAKPGLGAVVAATVHHDRFGFCLAWDAADSFDASRAAGALNGRYIVTRHDDGTEYTAIQCNGDAVYWDGVYFVVSEP